MTDTPDARFYVWPCDRCGREAHYILEDERDGVYVRCCECGPPRALPVSVPAGFCCEQCNGETVEEATWSSGGMWRYPMEAKIFYSRKFDKGSEYPGWEHAVTRTGMPYHDAGEVAQILLRPLVQQRETPAPPPSRVPPPAKPGHHRYEFHGGERYPKKRTAQELHIRNRRAQRALVLGFGCIVGAVFPPIVFALLGPLVLLTAAYIAVRYAPRRWSGKFTSFGRFRASATEAAAGSTGPTSALNSVVRDLLLDWVKNRSVPGSEMEGATPRFAAQFSLEASEFTFDAFRRAEPARGWSWRQIPLDQCDEVLSVYLPDEWSKTTYEGEEWSLYGKECVVSPQGFVEQGWDLRPVTSAVNLLLEIINQEDVVAFAFHPLQPQVGFLRWVFVTTSERGLPYYTWGLYSAPGQAFLISSYNNYDVDALRRNITSIVNTDPWGVRDRPDGRRRAR